MLNQEDLLKIINEVDDMKQNLMEKEKEKSLKLQNTLLAFQQSIMEQKEKISLLEQKNFELVNLIAQMKEKEELEKNNFQVLENNVICKAGAVSGLTILIPEKLNKFSQEKIKLSDLSLSFSLIDVKSGEALKLSIGDHVRKDDKKHKDGRPHYRLEFSPIQIAENVVASVSLKDYQTQSLPAFLSPANPSNVSVRMKSDHTAGEKIRGVIQVTDEFGNRSYSQSLLQEWRVIGGNSFEKYLSVSSNGEFALVLEKKGKYEISNRKNNFPFIVKESKFDIFHSTYTLTPGPVVVAGKDLTVKIEPKDCFGNFVNEKSKLIFVLFNEAANLEISLNPTETSFNFPIPKNLSGSFKLFVRADQSEHKVSNIRILSAFPSATGSSASIISKAHIVGTPMVICLSLLDDQRKPWGKHFEDYKLAERYFDESVKLSIFQSAEKVSMYRTLKGESWNVGITTTKSGPLRVEISVNGEVFFQCQENFLAGPAEESHTTIQLKSESGRKLGEPQRLEVSLKDKHGNLSTSEQVAVIISDADKVIIECVPRIEGGVRVVEFTPKNRTLKVTVKCKGNSPFSVGKIFEFEESNLFRVFFDGKVMEDIFEKFISFGNLLPNQVMKITDRDKIGSAHIIISTSADSAKYHWEEVLEKVEENKKATKAPTFVVKGWFLSGYKRDMSLGTVTSEQIAMEKEWRKSPSELSNHPHLFWFEVDSALKIEDSQNNRNEIVYLLKHLRNVALNLNLNLSRQVQSEGAKSETTKNLEQLPEVKAEIVLESEPETGAKTHFLLLQDNKGSNTNDLIAKLGNLQKLFKNK